MKAVEVWGKMLPKWMQAVGIGGLLGVAFLHGSLWWMALLGGVAFVVFVGALVTARAAWWYGCLVGWVKMLLVTSWGWYILPLDWMGFTSLGVEVALFVSFWCLSAAALGVGYGSASYVWWRLRQHKHHLAWVAIVPLFLFADGVGSLAFSLVMSGPGSSPGIQYANGWLGFTLAEHELFLTVARVGGVYVLSLLFGLLVAGLWYMQQSRRYIWGAAGLLVCVATSGVSVLTYQPAGQSTVAVVHTAFAREPHVSEAMRKERRMSYREALAALSERPADYVLWPEDTRLVARLDTDGDWMRQLEQKLGDETVVVDSARRDSSITTLRAYLYDTAAQATYQFDKGYLVPQGEYVPYMYRLVAGLFGANDRLQDVLDDMNYRPGLSQTEAVVPDYAPAILFCFESVDPRGVRRVVAAREEVPFVAHIVSHAWFQRPPTILWHQLDTMLRVQAVWNEVPIVQAANQAPSKVYLPNGTSRVLELDIVGRRWSISYIEI